MPKSSVGLKVIRSFLTLFIGFHLFAIVLAPHPQSYLTGRALPVIGPYIKFFEFATSWGFFAPDPGPPPIFMEYELFGKTGTEIGRGRWPDYPDPYFFEDRQMRRIQYARFLLQQYSRVEKGFVPYLCKLNPAAASIRLWRVSYPIPSAEDVVQGKREIGDQKTLEREAISRVFCDRTTT